MGEGGGQILRTALALALVLRSPFRIANLRARRRRPGLQRQHLACVLAAAEISGAEVDGARLGSTELLFRPNDLRAGHYRFEIGTAGSTTLVLQTVLPPLLTGPGPTSLMVMGGTHNPLAPPYPFLELAYLPLLRRMGARIESHLDRPGYVPKGGGEVRLTIAPVERLAPVHLEERGRLHRRQATATVAGLPRHIAERELRVVAERLGWPDACLLIHEQPPEYGPGNVLTLELGHTGVTELFTGFGQRGVPAETVAERTVRAVERYLGSGAAVGTYLADQLLLPLALAGGGSFTTVEPTEHARTNWAVIRQFTGLDLVMERLDRDRWQLNVGT